MKVKELLKVTSPNLKGVCIYASTKGGKLVDVVNFKYDGYYKGKYLCRVSEKSTTDVTSVLSGTIKNVWTDETKTLYIEIKAKEGK